MIDAILRFAIRQRLFVLIGVLLIMAAGVYNALQLPIDVEPDITNKQVVINAVASALGPEEVERQITFPIELALTGMPHLQGTSSISQFGLSQVTVVFDDEMDIYTARQMVAQKLSDVTDQMPTGVRPQMGPISTGLGEIYHVKIDGPQSLMERRTLMDWTVRPQLLTVPGLAEVNTWGGEVRQFQVIADPRKLTAYGLSLREVMDAISSNNQNAGGSYIVVNGEQQLVRSIGLIRDKDEIGRMVVGVRNRVPITIDRIGTIVEGPAVRQGAMSEDGKGEQVYALTLLLLGENGRVVMQRVEDKLVSIQKTLPEGTRLTGFLNRSDLINKTLDTARHNLIEGGVLVVVVLFLFLLQIRAGLIVSSVIPVSMLIALIGMRYAGISGNLMSLGAIDFGMVVDGAVIIVENSVRHLVMARAGKEEISEDERLQLIEKSAAEVLRPSLFGVLIIIVTYLPIITLTGIEGKMFRPMGLTVIFALIGSLILSLTLVPALCAYFLKADKERANPILDRLAAAYARTLDRALDRHLWIAGAALVFCIVCLSLFGCLGSEFIPNLDEGAIAVSVFYPPSTPLQETIRRQQQVETLLRKTYPHEIVKVLSRIGRAEVATDPMLSSQADIFITLTPSDRWQAAKTKEELVAKVSATLNKVPGMAATFTQPIQMRMMEMIEGQGQRGDLSVKIYGADTHVLAQQGALLTRIIGGVPGAADVKGETTQGLPQLQITIRRDAIARYGIRAGDINAVVEAAVGSKTVSTFNDGTQRVDIAVRLPEAARSTPEAIGALLIPAPAGTGNGAGMSPADSSTSSGGTTAATSAPDAPRGPTVPLRELADIQTVDGPVQISRENGQRRYTVLANVRGRDLGSFVTEVQRRVGSQIKLPTGYRLEYGGTYEHLQSGRARLAIVVPVTFAAVFLMLFSTFGSLRQAFLVFTGIPFAVTGGILALLLRHMPFSLSAGVGFIALGGIAVLNGVVLVTFINDLRRGGSPVKEAVREGARERLRPILMTASVASIGFIPMAISSGSGAEVQRPLATVVIGGLITSTLLTLFVLPTLFAWLEKDKKEGDNDEKDSVSSEDK